MTPRRSAGRRSSPSTKVAAASRKKSTKVDRSRGPRAGQPQPKVVVDHRDPVKLTFKVIDELPALERLRALRDLRADVDRRIVGTVKEARELIGGFWKQPRHTWERIADSLGVTKQAAQKKYGS